ncbi:MAG: serine protease [Chitinivibrionales bacterium]|nr:serine protease [Chitinivibrionales bacterium]
MSSQRNRRVDKLILPIVLQVGGVVTVLAEFLLPSGGLLTVAALGLFGWSLYLVFTDLSPAIGMAFVMIDAVMIPMLILMGVKLIARSPFALRSQLAPRDGAGEQEQSRDQLVGKEGTVISDCRPAGRARIDGVKYDVVSAGDYLVTGTDIVVTTVTGNRIVVRKKR